jgi:hypothetical protein
MMPEPMSGCWIWIGQANGCGYPMMSDAPHRFLAHRWSYAHFIGAIDADLTIDHLCRNTMCVNPAHLDAVTIGENIRRSPIHYANPTRTTCKRGHAYGDLERHWVWNAKGTRKWLSRKACPECYQMRRQGLIQPRKKKFCGPIGICSVAR